MELLVEELAGRAGISVDTLRFYQGRGLLPPPRRRGRRAIYGDAHLARLRRIRGLLAEGFTLAQIRRLLEGESGEGGGARRAGRERGDPTASLLEALVEESVGERTFSRAELAGEAGVPEALLTAAQAAGPLSIDGEERFGAADLEMFRAALVLLGAGFPLNELLQLAVEHAGRIQCSADAAIDLFDRSVIGGAGEGDAEADAIADAFRRLLPQVTRLVALHFQRTLVNRALERLRARGDREALEAALVATESGRLEISWQR